MEIAGGALSPFFCSFGRTISHAPPVHQAPLHRLEQLDDGLVPLLGSPQQRRLAILVVSRVDIDLAYSDQQLDDGLLPVLGGPYSGISPFLSLALTSTLPMASSSLTTASCPFWAAHDSGVRPTISLVPTSTFASSALCKMAINIPKTLYLDRSGNVHSGRQCYSHMS